MFGIGVQELVIILLIVLVLFGGKKIPELARSIGQAIKELRSGISGDEDKQKKASGKTAKK